MVGTAGSVAKESTEIKYGTYSMKIISGSSNQYAAEYAFDFLSVLERNGEKVVANNYFPGRTMTFGMWVKCSTASKARIYIDDGISKTYSSYHTGGGSFEFLTVEKQLDAEMNKLVFGCEVASSTITAYFDSGIACDGELLYTDFRGNNIYVRESEWEPSVTFSFGSFVIPRRDGVQVHNSYIREGKIRIKVQIHQTTYAAARTIFDTIIKAVADGQKDLYFEDDRVSEVRLTNIPTLTYLAGAYVHVFDLVFSLVAPVKRFIGMIRTKVNVTSSPTSFNVEVNGSYKTYPVLYFLPAAITLSSTTLENLTTGKRFIFTDNVPAGGTLRANCDIVEVLNEGVDALSYSTGDYPEMVPGTNYFKFTGTAGITIFVDHFNQFL
ncbi:MAG: tail protein [Siphoviridae sp. ctCJE6]|nr:MAG: tail protein [Siphoviridae sp. ctCJE6]